MARSHTMEHETFRVRWAFLLGTVLLVAGPLLANYQSDFFGSKGQPSIRFARAWPERTIEFRGIL